MNDLPQAYREIWEYPRRAWWRVIWTFAVSLAAWCAVLVIFVLIIGARA